MDSSSATQPPRHSFRDRPTQFRLNPALGSWQMPFLDVKRLIASRSASSDDLRSAIEDAHILGKSEASGDGLKFVFTLSLIADIIDAGGKANIIDSEVVVSWPDWNAPEGRETVRKALNSAKAPTVRRSEDANGAHSLFAPSMSPNDVLAFMSEGSFWLEAGDAKHPSGSRYTEAFSLAIDLWSMPYRGREGRARRFVVVGTHPTLAPSPIVIGLIEIGDDAPYSTLRDVFLSLKTDSLLNWIDERADAALKVSHRMGQFRSALKYINFGYMNGTGSLSIDDILSRTKRLEERASGRSLSYKGNKEKKRLAYLVRLAHGEAGLKKHANGSRSEKTKNDISQGVRAVHNLTLPRIHMDITVCGALPPFSSALAGKLIVSFLGDPRIRACTKTPPGKIVSDLMDADDYLNLVPNDGILAITTKGLYPGHSALYNRSSVPGDQNDLVLAKLGETQGATTTLLSPMTSRFAQAIVECNASKPSVSRAYGTGGSKRQRALETAAQQCDIPSRVVHAGIKRPMYALSFISNMADVVWGGDSPNWRISKNLTQKQYSDVAVSRWRQRWLSTAKKRLSQQSKKLHGVTESLNQGQK